MEGKVIIITGGATGIGLSAASLFLRNGATVIIAGRREQEGQAALHTLRTISTNVSFMATDVSRSASVEALFKNTYNQFGRIDVAFNNAGIEGTFSTIEKSEETEFDEVMQINLKGTWLCIRQALMFMKKQEHGGTIINTSSWLSKGAFPNSSIYSASKAGIDAIVRSVALESAPFGIRINNVNPGYIVTPMFRRSFDPESPEAAPFKKHAPIGRFAEPDEVAELVYWLASDKASFITGQSISVDGGLTIPGPRF